MVVWIWWGAAIAVLAVVGAVSVVLYFELRNQHHIWRDPCITPLQTRDDIRHVLSILRTVLEGKGVAWWLDYGTLLGAWRIGDTMAFDHDLDLSYLGADDDRLRACIPELLLHGIELNMERTSLFYGGRKVGDMERWSQFGAVLCRDDPKTRSGVAKFWRPLVDDFPAALVRPLWSIRFNGQMYPCPNNPEQLLRRRYLTCRLHLRLVIPHKQKCWTSRAFWREAAKIWFFRDAPYIRQVAEPAGRS